MTDPSLSFDPRTTLARPDLAALALEGRVRADTYRAVEPMRGTVPVADIHADASPASERIDQLLYGEIFDVLERRGARVWGQARRDGTVGWMDAAALGPNRGLPSRRVTATRAFLPLNALVDDTASPAGDLAPIGAFETDWVAVAERLLGVPHSLGARSSVATDCSGLVQQALFACGMPGPRRAHEQARLGQAVSRDAARRGDLVIWLNPVATYSCPGHTGLMLDQTRLIHATGHHGAVVIEAFADADARCLADNLHPAVFRRLP